MNSLHITERPIYVGKSVEYLVSKCRGTNLILNKFICSSLSNDLPNFSKSLFLFSVNSEIYAVCERWNTLELSFSCLGYVL